MVRKLIKKAKRLANEQGYTFIRWNVGFTKHNGIEYRYPVLEFKKECGGISFLEPVLYLTIPCNPFKRLER